MLQVIGSSEVCALTAWPRLIAALEQAFRVPCEMPMRSQFDIGGKGTMLLMPAWSEKYTGVKLVQVFAGNAATGKPVVNATYLLCSAETGEQLAHIDGESLTTRRTAAASALASRYLSRLDAQCLLLLGAGRLAFDVACAHAAVRPLRRVLIWARRAEQSHALAERLAGALSMQTESVSDPARAAGEADIISTVTTAREPILNGSWVRPGTHVDLIGGFTPGMREADDMLVSRGRLFADSRAAVLREAGDYVQPLERGLIGERDLQADLFQLCAGAPGRRASDEITVFKSVGLALEDLAAATLIWEQFGARLGARATSRERRPHPE